MTGVEFEAKIVSLLGRAEYWAHRISPNAAGQQPFDVIAIGDNSVMAFDCKVVSKGFRFPFSRIEDNQRSAMDMISTFSYFHSDIAEVGFLIWVEEAKKIYFLPYHKVLMMEARGKKSVDMSIGEIPLWRMQL